MLSYENIIQTAVDKDLVWLRKHSFENLARRNLTVICREKIMEPGVKFSMQRTKLQISMNNTMIKKAVVRDLDGKKIILKIKKFNINSTFRQARYIRLLMKETKSHKHSRSRTLSIKALMEEIKPLVWGKNQKLSMMSEMSTVIAIST